jgi:hypothetical protein
VVRACILQARVPARQAVATIGKGGAEIDRRTDESVEAMLRAAVDGVLSQNDVARDAFRALLDRGLDEEEAREEIARVLMGVTAHVRGQTDRLRAAGGGAELRREAFRRIASGERAADVFE